MEGQNLSLAEVWHDSALVNVWDSVLQEYKKYHSIRTTGGHLEEALAGTKQPDVEVKMTDVSQADVNAAELNEETPMREESGNFRVEVGDRPVRGPAPSVIQQDSGHPHSDDQIERNATIPESIVDPSITLNVPQFPLGGPAGENEALRNLMISWYFAGYYTGLYEGQQQREQQQMNLG